MVQKFLYRLLLTFLLFIVCKIYPENKEVRQTRSYMLSVLIINELKKFKESAEKDISELKSIVQKQGKEIDEQKKLIRVLLSDLSTIKNK